jgi:ABC-type Zn uptake system ZnuABC Zn-binding protein ZnuA
MIHLAKAQVLIVNGLGYESWLQKSLDGLEGQRLIITATAGLTPLIGEANGISAPDPHMWMDPLNVVEYARQIRDGLTQADPAGKDTYAANAETYILKLNALAAEVKSQINTLPEERRLLVTNHDALTYFAQAYGLKVVGAVIPSVSSDTSPSAREIISLIQAIKQSGAGVIFLNLGENQKLAEQIGEETNVKVEAGLYVESLSSSGGPADTYLEMIKYDANLIAGALK